MERHSTQLGLFFLVFFIGFQTITAQNGVNKEKYQLTIKQAIDVIKIDGKLTENSWQIADATRQFNNKWPTDKGLPPLQTTVKMTYDDNFLYIGAICEDDSKDYIIQTLKRDNVIWSSDGFAAILDPVNTQTNGFIFYTNALGVQTEGLVSAFSNNDGMSRDWDNTWFVETTSEEGGRWMVEMAIPFKTLRYDASLSEWGINFLRCDVGNNKYSTWAYIPLQFNGTDLSYAGTLIWDKPPKKTTSNISIIPYVTGDLTQDFEEEDGSIEPSFNAGLDAKVAVSSSLNLDLTINPDFSQVEVDIQQTNLTRFSLFFPERRTFFLENSDLFSDFGIPPIRPFFSRRIGLDDDGNSIPILFGARLSGNLTENMRIGLMSMQTGETDTETGQNYSVAAFQQRVFQRGSIKGLFINRQAFTDGEFDENDFGRNVGGEFNYFTPDGKYGGFVGYHAAFKPEKYSNNDFFNIGGMYNTREFSTTQAFSQVGENFITDAGFNLRLDNYDAENDTTVRLGFRQVFQEFNFSIYAKNEKPKVNFHRFRLENFMVWNDSWHPIYRQTQLSYMAFLASTAMLRVAFTQISEELPFATNILGDDYDNLPVGWYHYGNVGLMYRSNRRKLFAYTINANYGRFYNGDLIRIGGSLQYRQQPWGTFALNFERNIVTLPENYGEARLWLVGPRIEVNFSKNLFWTTFIQYNTQADNFNINSRLQWRFKPMSDVFLVYTDNYEVVNFGPKNRALVLKFNWWLTL